METSWSLSAIQRVWCMTGFRHGVLVMTDWKWRGLPNVKQVDNQWDGLEPALLTYVRLSFGSPLFPFLSCPPSQFLELLNFCWPLRVSNLVLPWISPSYYSFSQHLVCWVFAEGRVHLKTSYNALLLTSPLLSSLPNPTYWYLSYPLGTSELTNKLCFIDDQGNRKCYPCGTEVRVRVGQSQCLVLRHKKRELILRSRDQSLESDKCLQMSDPLLAVWPWAS